MIVTIIGSGPAGLMAGYELLKRGFKVSFYEKKKASGRKFLVAGHGGFNLSNNKPIKKFLSNYDQVKVQNAVNTFDVQKTEGFLDEIGIPFYYGSTGKLFPKTGIKPIDVLNNWMLKIEELGGVFYYEHKWIEGLSNELIFEHKGKAEKVHSDYTVFALGGGSWEITGSDGAFTKQFEINQVKVNKLKAYNAGFNIKNWTSDLEGNVIKNCAVKLGAKDLLGEIVLTNYGLEGSPIYALNDQFYKGHTNLQLDFKPSLTQKELVKRLQAQKGTRKEQLMKLKLSKSAVQLLRMATTKEEFLDDEVLVNFIKSFSFRVESLRPLEESISTNGGVDLSEVTSSFELKKFPKTFLVGEMLDWNAPTGGYLLQACFATGWVVGHKIISLQS